MHDGTSCHLDLARHTSAKHDSSRHYLAHRAAILLGLALLAGCSGGDGRAKSSTGRAGAGGERERKIGYSALTLTNKFFQVIGENLESEAAKHGYRVVTLDADRNVKTQSDQINDFIAMDVAAIVLNPTDQLAIAPAIKRANAAGIPVFTCDLECTAEGIQIAGHVGTDNYQGGKLAGQAMIEALGQGGGRVLVLHFKQANSCVLRVKGFHETIDAHNASHPDAKIEVIAELEGGGLSDESYRATSDSLQAHANLAGIFAINDPSALGAWKAVHDANRHDQIKIVGFDGQPDGKMAIRDGKIFADPIQFPDYMGRKTIENIISHLNGEPFETNELIETKLYYRNDGENDPELNQEADQASAASMAPRGLPSPVTADQDSTPDPLAS